MSKVLAIEQAIAIRLQPLVAKGYELLNHPEPDEYGGPVRFGSIFVAYTGGNFDRLRGDGGMRPRTLTQLRELRFDVLLKIFDLTSHQGAYPILEEIELLLNGWQPLKDVPRLMFQTSEDFVDVFNNVWQWVLGFEISIPTLLSGELTCHSIAF